MKKKEGKKMNEKGKRVERELANPRYMMATKAIHQTGDISRDAPDICVVTHEDGENYVGNWVMGYGFIHVLFPKMTTWELTQEEKEHYHGMIIQVGSYFQYTLKTLDPVNVEEQYRDEELKVKTHNSTYLFGRANKNGERTIFRDESPLDFNRCRIAFLAIDERMEIRCFEGPHPMWYTSEVISIN
jgi:hypothetical protein